MKIIKIIVLTIVIGYVIMAGGYLTGLISDKQDSSLITLNPTSTLIIIYVFSLAISSAIIILRRPRAQTGPGIPILPQILTSVENPTRLNSRAKMGIVIGLVVASILLISVNLICDSSCAESPIYLEVIMMFLILPISGTFIGSLFKNRVAQSLRYF